MGKSKRAVSWLCEGAAVNLCRKEIALTIQDAMRRGNAASLFFRVSCGRKVLETGKSRIRELILELLSEVHFLGHDFERFEIMA